MKKNSFMIFFILFTLFLPILSSANNNQNIINELNANIKKQQDHKILFDIENNGHSLQWTALQGPQMGKQIQVVQLKNHSNNLFAFRPYSKGQIFQSNDTGKSWKALPSPSNTNLYDLAAINENQLILGTDTGLYLSEDLGQHWRFVNNLMHAINNIVVINPNLILLLTDQYTTHANIYRSMDGGHSWVPIHLGLNISHSIWTIAGKNNILLASSNGLNMSVNSGEFWTQPKKWKKYPVLSIAISNKYRVYAATGKLYQTDLDGHTWENIGNGIRGEIEVIKVDQHDRLYTIGKELDTQQSGLYRSSDEGKNWQLLHKFKQIDSFILLDNDQILITTQKGLMLSDQSQFNYSPLANTFTVSEITDVFATDKDHLFAIDSDYYWSTLKNALYRSEDAGKTWMRSYFGHANNIVEFNHQLVLAADKNLICASQDKGKTWQKIYKFDDEHSHIGLSAQNNVLVLQRTDGQYISYNLLNWKKINNQPYSYQDKIVYIDDQRHIFITTDNGIQYSTNEGKTWITLLKNIYAHGLISGYRSTVLIAAFYDAGVIKSNDGGKNWKLINDGLDNFHFRKLIVMDENHYYLATDQGFFQTEDGGKHWTAENNGLENKDTLSLFVQNNFFLAGTNGSGVYTATLINRKD